jgi:predicted nucleotidyltransferase
MPGTKDIGREDILSKGLSSLTPNERAGLADFVARLRQRYGDDLQRVVLFGSKARADFDDESDMDILVVVREKDHWQCWDEITDLTSQLLLETGVNISALVCDVARYQWWAVHRAPIYNSIQRDGVELWTKPSEPSLPYV